MTTQTLRAVLLDVDGTLVSSNDAHAHAWSQACTAFGYDRPPEFFTPLIGMGGDHVLPQIDAALRDDTEPGASIARRRGEIFRSTYLPTLRPTPGAKAFVEHLKARGLRCVIASSTTARELTDLLEVVGVSHLIDETTTSEDADTSKPAPDIVAAALRKANVKPDEAVLIGDTPYDVAAGERAGVRVVALRCGGRSDADLVGAAAIYDDPADMLAHEPHSPLSAD